MLEMCDIFKVCYLGRCVLCKYYTPLVENVCSSNTPKSTFNFTHLIKLLMWVI